MSDESPEGMIIEANNKKFLVGKCFAEGSFGRVHAGKNVSDGEEVAIKLEKRAVDRPQLRFEFVILRKLKADADRRKGIPKIHLFAPCGKLWSALIMDMLGPSLEKVHQNCGGVFTLKTTLCLAIQLIEIFDYFHGKKLVYRDMKPENFLFGRPNTDKYYVLHIIDFGLCKEWEEDGKHIPLKDKKPIMGTVRYFSINCHNGLELSRRDDMIALGYMIMFLIRGDLPWQGAAGETQKEKYKNILKIKESTKPDQLCKTHPREFATYMSLVMDLKFEAEPDYKAYRKLFSSCLARCGLKNDDNYDFDKYHKKKT